MATNEGLQGQAATVALAVTVPGDVHEGLAALVKASRREFSLVEPLAGAAVEAVTRGIIGGEGVTLLALGRQLYAIANMGKPASARDLAEFVLGRNVTTAEAVAFEVFLQEAAERELTPPARG